jgi:histidine triad (HIT) family protein
MPPHEVGKLYAIIPVIAKAVVLTVKADGFNVGQNNGRAANQIVPHVHVHIIPRFSHDSPDGKWPVRRVAHYNELIVIADKIKLQLNLALKSDIISNI